LAVLAGVVFDMGALALYYIEYRGGNVTAHSAQRRELPRLQRDSLREKICETLAERILSGDMAPGSRINESFLSRGLGVSPTPVREALLRLEGQGFLVAEPAKGFFVREFSEQEAHDVYSVLAELEALALEAAGIPPASTLEELERINDKLTASGGQPNSAIKMDDSFHATLLAACPNEYLLHLIGRSRRAIYRYEYAYMHEGDRIGRSGTQHLKIIAALRASCLDEAIRRLRQSWLDSVDHLLPWLRENKRTPDA
jgi:DNA-binding GntR family transcriptional regulator